LEVIVEEPSMEAALREFLPKLLKGLSFQIYPYQGKAELLQRLPERFQGYAGWLPSNWRILVVVDRDDDDCLELKKRLDGAASRAGLRTRSQDRDSWQVVNRLAIEELEAWYFGDWQAVRQAFPRVPETVVLKEGFRDPDAVRGGTWEAFEKVLQDAGYFRGGLRKIEAARRIGPHLEPSRSISTSFRTLCSAVSEVRSRA
jgi:Domain of unknown function (DUF4276)